MVRFGDIFDSDVAALADRLDLEFSDQELTDAADRMETLAGIYKELDAAPVERLAAESSGRDSFEAGIRRPGSDEDPYNAWLTRFNLSRPDADGPLSGLSVGVKDNTCVRGVELTCGSRAFEGVVPDEHAPVVERLLKAGATITGKTNMDEFAFGPTSETSAFGPTENPVAEGHVTGGSSSGSAAAVAAGVVDLALGTDTGGSVRIPASYCGIVGMKPTYGRVPLQGIVPLAYSMDHVGTLARNVETATKGLAAIADPDPDPDGGPAVDPAALGTDVESLTVGLAPGFFEKHTSDTVEEAVRGAVDELATAGAEVREVEIPALEYSRQAWWGLAPSEFAAEFAANAAGIWRSGRSTPSLVAGMGRVRHASSDALGSNIKEMLALGAYLNVEQNGYYYARARNLRTALVEEFDEALSEVDLLAAPGTPTTALEIDGFERGITPPVNWVTHPTNLTGHPSVALPCGEVDGLPVGLQFIGPTGADQAVLDAAYAYEQLS
jgi:Asp-tRNA(Asn)/Glu-tRNA(Gln) amidotransferase A subunit family amidase